MNSVEALHSSFQTLSANLKAKEESINEDIQRLEELEANSNNLSNAQSRVCALIKDEEDKLRNHKLRHSVALDELQEVSQRRLALLDKIQQCSHAIKNITESLLTNNSFITSNIHMKLDVLSSYESNNQLRPIESLRLEYKGLLRTRNFSESSYDDLQRLDELLDCERKNLQKSKQYLIYIQKHQSKKDNLPISKEEADSQTFVYHSIGDEAQDQTSEEFLYQCETVEYSYIEESKVFCFIYENHHIIK